MQLFFVNQLLERQCSVVSACTKVWWDFHWTRESRDPIMGFVLLLIMWPWVACFLLNLVSFGKKKEIALDNLERFQTQHFMTFFFLVLYYRNRGLYLCFLLDTFDWMWNFLCPVWLWAALASQSVKKLLAVQENRDQPLGQEDTLENEMATHFNMLAWKPWLKHSTVIPDRGM